MLYTLLCPRVNGRKRNALKTGQKQIIPFNSQYIYIYIYMCLHLLLNILPATAYMNTFHLCPSNTFSCTSVGWLRSWVRSKHTHKLRCTGEKGWSFSTAVSSVKRSSSAISVRWWVTSWRPNGVTFLSNLLYKVQLPGWHLTHAELTFRSNSQAHCIHILGWKRLRAEGGERETWVEWVRRVWSVCTEMTTPVFIHKMVSNCATKLWHFFLPPNWVTQTVILNLSWHFNGLSTHC